MRRFPILLLLSAVFLATTALSSAQVGTSSLRGTITDKSGAILAHANVKLINPARSEERKATSNQTGEYEFPQVPPGTYQLTVEMSGFRTYEQKDIQLLVNTPNTVNVTLEVGAVSEVVEVTGEAAHVNTTDATLGNAFGENQIMALPMEGRNVPDLLTLQAGVTYTGNRTDVDRNVDTRSGAVNGARSDQSNITLDGVDANDQVNGNAFTSVLPVTLDSVQEFRVTTTNANADQGRSSGAQVSLVTKSGTNSFHGSAYEYTRNTYTSANDYFVKTAELSSGEHNIPPKLIRNIFGGAVGGPIIKNRLFFFANYEGARERQEASVLRMVPSDQLRQGILRYVCDPTDPNCSTSNPNVSNTPLGLVAALTPAQIKAMDPLHLGNDPVMLQYFNTFPHANDLSQGDLLNFVGYRFRGSIPTNNNWYIARVDYKINASGTHSLFWRGALRNDTSTMAAAYLPGQAPEETAVNFSKGFVVGYTALLRSNLINNFHWGFTRQSLGILGNNDTQPFVFFRGLNDNETSNQSSLAVTRSDAFQNPLYNYVDDLSWTKGKHTIQFGANVRFIREPRQSFLTSFSSATTNPSGLNTAGVAGGQSPLNPGNHASMGLPAVASSFKQGYDWPIMAMMGIESELDATFNYQKSGNGLAALAQGAPLTRRFGADEYEFYLQDSFRMRPNLTLNYGLRYSLFSPPWETNGDEVVPTVSLGGLYQQRATKMLTGGSDVTDPIISYNFGGAANGKPGYYGWDYHDFGPHVSFAYSPRADSGWLQRLVGNGDQTVVRGGFGIVYDRVGAGLLNTFDKYGSFGLSTGITAPVPCVGPPGLDPSCAGAGSFVAPRLTGLNTLPQNDQLGRPYFPATPPATLPYTYPPAATSLAIQWGLDDRLKTPYSYTIDFSVGRELGHNMSLEVSYVGRLSHRLLSQEDLMMPLDIVDQKTGIDYFTAAKRLSSIGFTGVPTSQVNAKMVGKTAAYWQHIVKPLKPGDSYSLACSGGGTTDVVQAMYDLFSCGGGPVFGFGDETTPLANLDYWGSDYSGNGGIAGTLTNGAGSPQNYYPSIFGTNAFFNSQFHSLYAWRSIGDANYNAMQVVLRKRMSRNIQFDLNYTYSKSIDLTSDAERVSEWIGLSGNVINSWDPNALRGVSDFDTTHQINANWIINLPFGKGQWVGGNSGGVVDAFIGGWQLSGLTRWTSGFPVSAANGLYWPTNWQEGGEATQIAPAHPSTTIRPDGSVNLFPTDLPVTTVGLGPFRHDLPGESGTRNTLRGPGFAGLDMALSKRWKMFYNENHSLLFRWEVFNVPNLKRFDVQTITTDISSSSFGVFSGLLTNPRVMEFALRYEF